MKVWIKSDRWPWPVEKYRYPIEQMLVTLFPGEKVEFLDAPLEMFAPETGDMLITFRKSDWPVEADGTIEHFSLHVTTDVGPDLEEEPDREKDFDQWENWGAYCCGGQHRIACGLAAEQIVRTEEEAYHCVSRRLKESIYHMGIKMLHFLHKDPYGDYSLPWGTLTGVRPVKLPTRALLAGKTPAEAERELQTAYYVSEPQRKLAVECAQEALKVKRGLTNDGMALYIGVPFCPTRCAYCSFISSDVKGALALMEPYVDRLCEEIRLAGSLLRERGLHISCAYMGGGTPTTLSAEQLDRVLTAVERFLPMERCGEFTVEAGRPDTITADKLSTLRAHKIHRISINPQTMEDGVLRAIGRAHTAAQIEESMALARAHFGGLVNMDLIAGLPTDTAEGFARTLDRVLAMDPANITVHTLALKKGSRLIEEGRTGAGGELPAPETVAGMLQIASHRLREAGYAPYYLYRQKYMTGSFENVGWCRPGAVCAYNIVMMEELQTVLALGAGGTTKLVDYDNGKITRLNNPKYAREYLESWDRVAGHKHTAVRFQADLRQ